MGTGSREDPRVPAQLLTAPAGSCFGFAVSCDQPLRYLRALDGDEPPLQVRWGEGRPPDTDVEPLLVWEAPFAARLHRTDGRWHLWIEHAGWFTVDPAIPRIDTPPARDELRCQERVWGLPSVLCLLERGVLPLHAAVLDVDGRAVVVGGPGRAGKTTLAAAWAASGRRVLAEDLAAIELGPTPAVRPGPAMLRLRHDVARNLPSVAGEVVGRDDDRVHIAVDGPGDGRSVPLAAVVLLRDHESTPTLTATDPQVALRDLWAISFNLPTQEDRTRCFSQLAELLAAVPVLDLARRRVYDELPATVDALATLGPP